MLKWVNFGFKGEVLVEASKQTPFLRKRLHCQLIHDLAENADGILGIRFLACAGNSKPDIVRYPFLSHLRSRGCRVATLAPIYATVSREGVTSKQYRSR